jgi:hypothetical protein
LTQVSFAFFLLRFVKKAGQVLRENQEINNSVAARIQQTNGSRTDFTGI